MSPELEGFCTHIQHPTSNIQHTNNVIINRTNIFVFYLQINDRRAKAGPAVVVPPRAVYCNANTPPRVYRALPPPHHHQQATPLTGPNQNLPTEQTIKRQTPDRLVPAGTTASHSQFNTKLLQSVLSRLIQILNEHGTDCREASGLETFYRQSVKYEMLFTFDSRI